MWKRVVAAAIVWAIAFGEGFAEEQGQVDFGRDVQPLFRAHCTDCHGPKQQKNGFRLDRRRDALRGGTSAMIAPGNSEASRIYLRLIGDSAGPQMPPDGPLARRTDPDHQGVDRPGRRSGRTSSAGEAPAPPPDPNGDPADGPAPRRRPGRRSEAAAATSPGGQLRGPGGSTPLMFAALYGDAEAVRLLLEAGADPTPATRPGPRP